MTGIPLQAAADRIAHGLAAVLGPSATWVTPRWVQQVLEQPTRCSACHRPLYAVRSVAAGIGPTCRRKHVQKRSGGVSHG